MKIIVLLISFINMLQGQFYLGTIPTLTSNFKGHNLSINQPALSGGLSYVTNDNFELNVGYKTFLNLQFSEIRPYNAGGLEVGLKYFGKKKNRISFPVGLTYWTYTILSKSSQSYNNYGLNTGINVKLSERIYLSTVSTFYLVYFGENKKYIGNLKDIGLKFSYIGIVKN